MPKSWVQIADDRQRDLDSQPTRSHDVVVVSTRFDPGDKPGRSSSQTSGLTANSRRLLSECARVLRPGGLLFIYGPPRHLAFWGACLSGMSGGNWRMIFKYWIALDIDDAPRNGFLKPTHQGLLMYLKGQPNPRAPASLDLNTPAVRVPHASCRACGLNLKDWGGKKHLMNPRGAALSDVWRDLPRRAIRDSVIPNDVLDRIHRLTGKTGASHLHVVQNSPAVATSGAEAAGPVESPQIAGADQWRTLDCLQTNHVYPGDCVSFLKRVAALYPQGVFDLAFADPPYNLNKSYDRCADALSEQQYLEWSNAWLEAMAQTLKPGGSLMVLNLPKWAVHHAAFLNRRLEFRHWIAWDALSDPRGKLLPAHYALLYYTKPGGVPLFNYAPPGTRPRPESVVPPEAPEYCLRARCLKRRKMSGDDQKVELADVWLDIHRIKHKRDRDAHPCQLPEKLMERIIRLTTHRGGLVFDAFGGAGTTAVAAWKLGRRFVVTELDPNYVRITNEKLALMQENADLFGQCAVPRKPVRKPRTAVSKRTVELYLQTLARRLGRVPTEQDIAGDDPSVLEKIDSVYPTRGAALKRAKVALPGIA